MKSSFALRTLFIAALILLATSQECCERNTIEASGNAEVKVEPNRATLTISINSEGDTATAALEAAAAIVNSIANILAQNGVPEGDFYTSYLYTYPRYDYSSGSPVINGYVAYQSLTIIVRDLTNNFQRLGTIINDVAETGVSLGSVILDLEDSSNAKKQARQAAFENAKNKAKDYASLTYRTLGKVLSVEQTVPVSSGSIYLDASAFRYGVSFPIGTINLSVTMKGRWSLY